MISTHSALKPEHLFFGAVTSIRGDALHFPYQMRQSDFACLLLHPDRVQTALFMTQIQVMWDIDFMRYITVLSIFLYCSYLLKLSGMELISIFLLDVI